MLEANSVSHLDVRRHQLFVCESQFISQGQEGIYAVITGSLSVREKAHAMRLQAGELLFVKRGTYLVTAQWQDCQLVWLPLDPLFVQEFIRRHGNDLSLGGRHVGPGMNLLHFQALDSAMECVQRMMSAQAGHLPVSLSQVRLEELLMLLILSPMGDALLGALRQQGNRHVDRLYAFMEQHFLKEWRLDEFAKAFGLGLTAFKAMFFACYNSSPRAWISERRVLHAHNLLMNTSMSIVDVAMESGFSSQSYFSQSYRRHFGCTPSEARR